MRASLRTLRFMLYLPSAGLQSAVRRLHFNFRNNRAFCARFSDGLSATVMDIKI